MVKIRLLSEHVTKCKFKNNPRIKFLWINLTLSTGSTVPVPSVEKPEPILLLVGAERQSRLFKVAPARLL